MRKTIAKREKNGFGEEECVRLSEWVSECDVIWRSLRKFKFKIDHEKEFFRTFFCCSLCSNISVSLHPNLISVSFFHHIYRSGDAISCALRQCTHRCNKFNLSISRFEIQFSTTFSLLLIRNPTRIAAQFSAIENWEFKLMNIQHIAWIFIDLIKSSSLICAY